MVKMGEEERGIYSKQRGIEERIKEERECGKRRCGGKRSGERGGDEQKHTLPIFLLFQQD